MNTERLKIRLNRLLRRILAAPHLHLLSDPPPPRAPGEVWLFMACRDEALRLPAMLDYHFKLGVSRVILVDNGSTDATPDIARADSRIHLFQTSQTFAGNEIA